MAILFAHASIVLAALAILGACGGDDHTELFDPNDGAAGQGGTGANGCADFPTWMAGKEYTTGDQVRATCQSPGGGQTLCTVGVTYLFTCNNGALCAVYPPGVEGWWGAWSVGMACDH
ncbi:MAG TPA: hypothetical protein VF881_09765 [Polyangiaceae bacterium]